MNWFRIAWITWAAAGTILEVVALLIRSPGDTLSEQVWATRGSGFFSLLIFFLLWAIWHFMFDNGGG